MEKYQKYSSRLGFTLVELMIVITMIGILAAAIFPNMTTYLKRARDAVRAANLNTIAVGISAYEIDKGYLPQHSWWCYPSALLLSGGYIKSTLISPKGAGYDEWCGISGKYAYWVSTGNTLITQSSLLMANMENKNGGNYSGSTLWMTGNLTLLGHYNATYGTARWTGSIYILRPSTNSWGTAWSPPPPAVDGSCSALAWVCTTGILNSYNGWSCGGSSTWNCGGQYGWASVSCSVANSPCPPVNGACGTASGVATMTTPSSGLCNAGSPSTVTVNTMNYTWNCNGQYGWTSMACSAERYCGWWRWQFYTGSTTYPWCDTPDKMVCISPWVATTWSMCNVGSTVSGTGVASYGSMFQWWRNVPFPSTWTVPIVAWPLTLAAANATTSFINADGVYPYDWLTPQNDDLWWWSGTTRMAGTFISQGSPSAMQWPCATGYHVPTFKEMCDMAGSAQGWNFGFWCGWGSEVAKTMSMPPAGYRYKWTLTPWMPSFNTSTPFDRFPPYMIPIVLANNSIEDQYGSYREFAYSLRCIRNN